MKEGVYGPMTPQQFKMAVKKLRKQGYVYGGTENDHPVSGLRIGYNKVITFARWEWYKQQSYNIIGRFPSFENYNELCK